MVAVDWHTYFESIKEVCPWSWSAWHNDRIHFCRWSRTLQPLEHYEIRVHLCPNHSRRQLKAVTGYLNDHYTQYEWLWSEPGYGVYATPVPCILQQDAVQLETIRQRLAQREKSTSKKSRDH